MIANTPPPPYYAVIFTSIRNADDNQDYALMSEQMVALGTTMPGFLGIESARNQIGITVSYWDSLENIKAWKQNADHLIAQKYGREKWYSAFKARICLVQRDYGFEKI